MAKKALVYNDASISALKGLDPIRVRPTVFIGSLDCAGQVHMAKELVDNSLDELNNVNWAGYLDITLFRDSKRQTYQLMIHDNGRGFPLGRLVETLTVLWCSGKHTQGAYESSAGLLGVGAKCQSALSTKSKVLTVRYDGDGAGMVDMRNGTLAGTVFEQTVPQESHGSYVVYEPLPKWIASNGATFEIKDIDTFASTGFNDLVQLLRINDIFSSKIRYVVRIVDRPMLARLWDTTVSLSECLSILRNDSGWYTADTVYDSDTIPNKDHYLVDYLGYSGAQVCWTSPACYKQSKTDEDKLSFNIRLLMTRNAKRGGYLVLVNSIVMKMDTNSPQQTFSRVLHKQVAKYITDTDIKKFFLSSGYVIPVLVGMEIRYSGAMFTGTTKESFRDKTFEKVFEADLLAQFHRWDDATWEAFLATFYGDLESKYSMFDTKPATTREPAKMLLELNNSTQYTACTTTDRQRAELFIVEGTSAAHLKKSINREFQAVAATRGKPINGLSLGGDRRAVYLRLKADPIVSDLITISGVTPNTNDKSTWNFGKFIITTDADADGAHIATLHIANFYRINPLILESGSLYLSTPPLYSMNIKGKTILLRDKIALYDARIQYLYKNTFDFFIDSPTMTMKKLEGNEYRDFCYIVMSLGEAFENVSRLVNIPILILERLVYGINYLTPKVKIKELQSLFVSRNDKHFVRLTYNEKFNTLILSTDEKDTPISLDELGKYLREQLLPHLIPLQWRNWTPYLTTKLTHVHDKLPCTLMQIYQAMNCWVDNKLVRVDRYKGLGEAPYEILGETITNPSTRTLYKITSIGDAQRIFDLLSKDALFRKQLMCENGSLSGAMTRAHKV